MLVWGMLPASWLLGFLHLFEVIRFEPDPFNQKIILLRTYYVPSTVLNADDTAMNETDKILAFLKFMYQWSRHRVNRMRWWLVLQGENVIKN